MPRRLEGRRRKRGKWQAYVDIPGRQLTKTFPLTTPQDEIDAWRAEQLEHYTPNVPEAESFAADVQTYAKRRGSLPTIGQRLAHLDLWLQALGRSRARHSITGAEIEVVLESWLEAGLAPGTVKKRRTALQSFFVALNGKRGKNPVKGTPIPKEPKPEARQIPRPLIERAIAAMPKYRSMKPGAPRVLSLSPLRAQVIADTGIPPGLLQRVQPHDLELVGPVCTVRVMARKKGGGAEARTLVLTADGATAFRAFHAGNAYGPFATESLNRAFKRGCKSVGLDPRAVRLYDLRHSFLTDLYRASRDLATVGRFAMHAEGSAMTGRYAKGANREVDEAAAVALEAHWTAVRQASLKTAAPVQKSATILPANPARRRKLRAIS